MLFLQIAAWLAHSPPSSLCSNVTFKRPVLTTFTVCPLYAPALPYLSLLFPQYLQPLIIYLFIMFTHENTRPMGQKLCAFLFTNEYPALGHCPAHNIVEWLNILMRCSARQELLGVGGVLLCLLPSCKPRPQGTAGLGAGEMEVGLGHCILCVCLLAAGLRPQRDTGRSGASLHSAQGLATIHPWGEHVHK